ncbi:hypothetical protein HanPI659440_Chr00c29g0737021 [Helianthus annuus]|nr:hypothetical protein HanPI659440_Chr00c29g0737021 [Helianthus annuus]
MENEWRVALDTQSLEDDPMGWKLAESWKMKITTFPMQEHKKNLLKILGSRLYGVVRSWKIIQFLKYMVR